MALAKFKAKSMMSVHSQTTRCVSRIVVLALLAASSGTAAGQSEESFDPMEVSIQEVQQAMEAGLVTSADSRSVVPGSHRRL